MGKTEKKGKAGRLPGLVAGAFVAAVAVFGVMLYSEKKVLATEETKTVVIAKKEIAIGTLISEANAEEYFETFEAALSIVPQMAVADICDMYGYCTACGITEGTIMTESYLTETDEEAQKMKEPVLVGFKAEDLYQTTGGILRTGDHIHIYSLDDEGNTILRWSNIYIVQAFDSSGECLNIGEEGKALRFNIYLEKEDVPEFYDSLEAESLKVVKVCR